MCPLLLPAMSTRSGQLSDIFLPLFLLLIAVVVGAAIIHFLRRSMRRSQDRPDEGFTLHDLRVMHKSGALSDEEFRRARAKLLEQVGRAAEDAPEDSPEGPKKTQNEQPD